MTYFCSQRGEKRIYKNDIDLQRAQRPLSIVNAALATHFLSE